MTGKYDYSKYKGEGWNSDLEDKEFWGLHEIGDRVEVDIKRFIAASEQVSITDFVKKEFSEESFPEYYIPSKQYIWDYTCNFLQDKLTDLRNDWQREYRPLFTKITTPSEVEENSRLDRISYVSNSEMIEDCELAAKLDGIRRIHKYKRILNEMYCMFISKICSEIDRYLIKAITTLGYEGDEYNYKTFEAFCNRKNGEVSLKSLEGYKEFSDLHNVNNFIKHSSEKAFGALVKFSPECLRKTEGYENGMYPGDWLNFKGADIENFFIGLRTFFSSFCSIILGEDLERAQWDSDEYFLKAWHELRCP